MPTFSERVRDRSRAGSTPDAITAELLQLYSDQPELMIELAVVFRHEISGILAKARHGAEDKAFRHGDPQLAAPRSASATARINMKAAAQQWRDPSIAQWLATRVHLPDGATLTWGELSADQHQDRATSLQVSVSGRLETIRRHHVSRQLILDNAVACLNDLELETAP